VVIKKRIVWAGHKKFIHNFVRRCEGKIAFGKPWVDGTKTLNGILELMCDNVYEIELNQHKIHW
jgi:hypothetical protein